MKVKEIHPGMVALAWVPYTTGGGGVHPVIIVGNEHNCERGIYVLAVPGSSNLKRPPLPMHWTVDVGHVGLAKTTRFKCENVGRIEKGMIIKALGQLSPEEYSELQLCLMRAFHWKPAKEGDKKHGKEHEAAGTGPLHSAR